MNAYKVDTAKKTITIDDAVKATAADDKDIMMYVSAGYMIKHKSVKRAKQAAARAAEDNFKDADIVKALKDDKEGLAKYNAIKTGSGKGSGFFAAKKWYKDNYLKNK